MRQLTQHESKLVQESVLKNNYNEAQEAKLIEAVLQDEPCNADVYEIKALFVGDILISLSKSVNF